MSRVMRKPTFWFPTWSDTNQAVQLQKMARGLKFWIKIVEGLYYLCSKTKTQISFVFTAKLICNFVFAYAKTKLQISFPVNTKLICNFVFAYAKSQFSHDEAQI